MIFSILLEKNLTGVVVTKFNYAIKSQYIRPGRC